MRIGTSALQILLLLAGCGAEEDFVRDVTSELRANLRVQVSVKASAEEPTAEDLLLRKKLEDRIEQDNIGRLVSSGGGAGYYDVTVEVENTAEAIPRIQEILRSMDLDRDAKFKVMEAP